MRVKTKAIDSFVFFAFIPCFQAAKSLRIILSNPGRRKFFRLAGERKVLYLNLIFIYVIISLLNF